MEIEKIKGFRGFRRHHFNSFQDYEENYEFQKFHTRNDFYRVKDVEIASLVNKTTGGGDYYFLLLKSGDKQIKGLARIAVEQRGCFNIGWKTQPSDIVRAKKGDKVVIGGYYYELNEALKGIEIPIRFLKAF